MGFDLLAIFIISLIYEKIKLKDKYVLFSPFSMFHLSFFYVYIMPIVIYGTSETMNYLNSLDEYIVNDLLMYSRIFYYIFCISEIFFLKQLRSNRISYLRVNIKANDSLVLYSSFLLLGLGLFIDLYRVNFNLLSYIYLMIDPRSFTYLREGLGAFTILSSFIRLMLIYISFLYYYKKKTIISVIYLFLCGTYCVLGGSKSSLLFIIIFSILLHQKYINAKITFKKICKIAFSFTFVVLVSFYIMSGSITLLSIRDVINFVVIYSQEAFFSAMVINDFEWNIEHILLLIKGFIFTPIPRSIFTDKQFYSFYNVYWHDLYQPNSPIFHTSTYGFLAEGHMIMGIVAPFVYGLLISYFLKVLYEKYYSNVSFVGCFMCVYLISRIYFFTRTSFLDPTSIWTIIIYWIFLRSMYVLLKSNIKINNTQN